MSAARARLRSAIAEGARTAELEVTHLRTYPSATFGAVADRVPCLLRVPLADIVDAETYGDALTRAGADLVASP